MPKKTPEPEQAPKADNYAKINMPAAFLTPHDIQTSDGRTFEKCFVSFPKGTKVNGIDVSGFSTDVFLSDYMKKDMLEKGRATVSFKKDEPVPIWTGKKDDAEHPYQLYEVKATDLTHALKVAQDSYKAEKAAERAAAKDGVSLAKEGFVVMPYMYPDLNAARALADAGAACIMPLGSPIGSNKGLSTKDFIQILIDEIDLPIIVDAGIGRPSQACEAMEMGASAVMANTAIATAGNVPAMAEAFKKAIEAGRSAYLSGLGRTIERGASASSPLTGFLEN